MNGRIIANEEIYGYSVILIDEYGKSLGETNKRNAIIEARAKGLDLVMVGKDKSGSPICKYADAGKLKYEASKKKHTAKPVETGMIRIITIGT